MEKELLGLDSSFRFSCTGCGTCCRCGIQIALDGVDLYHISKYIGRSVRDVFARHCETRIDAGTGIPAAYVRLSSDGSCSFSDGDRCTVQEVKPFVCRLYPLGGNYTPGGNMTFFEVDRFITELPCSKGHTENQNIKLWLGPDSGDGKMVERMLWMALRDIARKGAEFFGGGGYTEKLVESLWNAMFYYMYIGYDTGQGLVRQIEINTALLSGIFDRAETYKEEARVHPFFGDTIYAKKQ